MSEPGSHGVLGVVLAGGAGSRYGQPKALVEVEGRRWVDQAVATLRGGGVDRVLVISGAWDAPVEGADVLHNPRWREGMATSLALALSAAEEQGAKAIIVTLVDLPGLTPEHVAKVLAVRGALVQAVHAGEPGHPVKIAAEHFAAMRAALVGDRGGREYLRRHGVVEVPFDQALPDQDYPHA